MDKLEPMASTFLVENVATADNAISFSAAILQSSPLAIQTLEQFYKYLKD